MYINSIKYVCHNRQTGKTNIENCIEVQIRVYNQLGDCKRIKARQLGRSILHLNVICNYGLINK